MKVYVVCMEFLVLSYCKNLLHQYDHYGHYCWKSSIHIDGFTPFSKLATW